MSTGLPQESVKGYVVRIASEPRPAAKGGYLFRGLELAGDGDNARRFIIFPEFVGNGLYEFPLLCWEGALVACFDLQLNNRLEDGSIIYTATPDSELVLEPLRPVSVTEAIEAATCVRIAEVRYRAAPDEPFWMGKGKLVHTLFEHLLQSGADTSEQAFQQAYRKALPAFMAMLPGSRIASDDRALEDELRDHFENLAWWLRQNNGLSDPIHVEADRISTRLGLKGRADAVLDDGDRRTVLELKSGKVPVESHLWQLSAYCMLFAFGEKGRFPDGYVIYSANGKSEKLSGPDLEWRRAIVDGRNKVISLKYSHTDERGVLSPHACQRTGKCFSRAVCRRLFSALVKGTGFFQSDEQQRYYNWWFRLLSLDAWAEEADFARVLDCETIKDRIQEGRTVPVEFMEVQPENRSSESSVEIPGAINRPETPGSATRVDGTSGVTDRTRVELGLGSEHAEIASGEEVILHRGDPCAEEAIRGKVRSSAIGSAVVSLRLSFMGPRKDFPAIDPRLVALRDDDGWFLDRVPFSRGRDVTRQALLRFFAKAQPTVIREVLRDWHSADAASAKRGSQIEPDAEVGDCDASATDFPSENPLPGSVGKRMDTADLCFSEGVQSELNEDQGNAIQSALDSQVFHIIHGPPGTGKTRVLARLIRICLDRGERLLVTCPTNVALDRLLIAIMELGASKLIRIGGRSTVSGEFLNALARLGNPPTLLPDLCEAYTNFKGFLRHVTETPLIGATAYQCAAHPIFLRQRFDRVVVDEAGQLDEPATLAPLALAPKFILGGDHLQLPPLVKVPRGADSGQEFGLERSLFERLFLTCSDSRISRLTVQYRMNLEIQDIPSRIFYENSLVPSSDVARRRLNIKQSGASTSAMDRIIDPELPVVFVDVQGPDSGKARPEEAQTACSIVENLLKAGVPANEIGIITPYRAQQALIRAHLAAAPSGKRPGLSVDTVDRFQGGEREVIILSLARSDGVTSFLADRKRLNVSLSRARSKLILLGHGPVLREHPLFCSILDGLEQVTV
jgi:DNA replication ATP-dependent helicase Dna2